jgi:hypothetical protein
VTSATIEVASRPSARAIDDDDARPLGRERGGDRVAEPPRPADDDGHVSAQLKVHRTTPGRICLQGPRLYQRRSAG